MRITWRSTLYTNNSLHLSQTYAWIFVCGHHLFREVNNFPRAKLVVNFELCKGLSLQHAGHNLCEQLIPLTSWDDHSHRIKRNVLSLRKYLLGNITRGKTLEIFQFSLSAIDHVTHLGQLRARKK